MKNSNFFSASNISYIFLFLSFFFFFYHLSNIPRTFFDEFHYIPAAKQWLLMNPTSNLEHPPVGKYLIATGIKFFGDNPIGWRASSAIFGAISLAVVFLIAEILFKDLIVATLIGLISMFNFWFYVQSRIAMLDIFMVSFLLLAFYYYLKYRIHNVSYFNFYLSSVFFGLSVAVKWSAVFIYLPFFLLIILSNLNKKKIFEMFIFGAVSVMIYFFTFLPYLFVTGNYKMSLSDIIFKTPFLMLKLQESVPANHPYASPWYTWPIMIRPIWYEFIQSVNHFSFRGVVLLGNPLQMFLGAISVTWILINIKKVSKITSAILILFLSSWLVWAITPRKLSFFYYYFPSAIFYSFLIPLCIRESFDIKMQRLILGFITILSLGIFLYFFPILSGEEVLMSIRAKWHWLDTWI
ncbi:MAG: phospholipid carrier-dependent glycosyltransferase [Bacteriovorax sp.]|nr:phospholipid carrier-dependent glycosyltransferase [Bacteriovorax sp.]